MAENTIVMRMRLLDAGVAVTQAQAGLLVSLTEHEGWPVFCQALEVLKTTLSIETLGQIQRPQKGETDRARGTFLLAMLLTDDFKHLAKDILTQFLEVDKENANRSE